MGIQSENAVMEACSLIETCFVDEASALLQRALTSDLENEEMVYAIQCCNFWHGTIDYAGESSYFERGERLLNQWKHFLFLEAHKNMSENRILYSFRKGIFSRALEYYSKASDEKDRKLYSEICRKKGLCYKKLGSYEEALKLLTEANSSVEGSSDVLAEMADCYALCGETKSAKILFREAFFLDAQKVDLCFLDSELIKVLIGKVEEQGYSGAVLQEWIPVYGVLYRVFNVKRLLRSQEVLRLQQEIYSLDSQWKDPENNRALLTPRLLNHYFWLIDYYLGKKDCEVKISEIKLRIKVLDPDIYRIYDQ